MKEFSDKQDKLHEKALEENLKQEAMGKKVVGLKVWERRQDDTDDAICFNIGWG